MMRPSYTTSEQDFINEDIYNETDLYDWED